MEAKESPPQPQSPPLYRFPLKNPTPQQIENGIDLRARRDTVRLVGRTVLTVLVLFLVLNDITVLRSLYHMDNRIQEHLELPPFDVVVIDGAKIPLPDSSTDIPRIPTPSADSSGKGVLDLPTHFPDRGLPFIKPWRTTYPLPVTVFLIIFWSVPFFHYPSAHHFSTACDY